MFNCNSAKRDVHFIWIFLLLTFNLVSFIPFSNEETYFALAKQFMNPEWIPGSFTLTEWPGTRLVSQYIIGGLLRYMSFEELTFWGRLTVFFVTSIPVASIFRYFRLNLVESLLLIQLYIIAWQSFFAGEWIFKAFEGKTIAYVFVFYSLLAFLKKRSVGGVVMASIATYFHVLVGGWFMLAVLIWQLVESRSLLKVIKEGAGYALLTSPFIWYLGKTILMDSRSVINGVNIDWVYVYFRNAHHTAPFGTWDCFLKNFAIGIVLSIIVFVFFIRISGKLEGITASLNRLNIVIFSILFLFLFIGIFDRDGSVLKFYTFRLSGLSLFLSMTELLLILKKFKSRWYSRDKVFAYSLALLMLLFTAGTVRNVLKTVKGMDSSAVSDEIASSAKTLSRTGDVFLYLNEDAVDFIRKSERERFVVYKFDPGGGEKIYDWYTRVLEKRKLEKSIEHLAQLKKAYRVDFLISDKALNSSMLKERWSNGKYWIYGVI